jgi:hypothetical protein
MRAIHDGVFAVSPITLRRWHSYIGAFVAPSVLFFTLTGALQLFSLHEDHGSYHAPVLLERLSSLHKDQVLDKHKHEESAKGEDAGGSSGSHSDHEASREPHEEKSVAAATLALKFFFLAIALGLTLSTCFGVWMSLQTPRKGLPLALLLTGTLLPIILLVS